VGLQIELFYTLHPGTDYRPVVCTLVPKVSKTVSFSDHYVCAGSLVEYPLKLRSQLAAAVTVQKFSHGISGSNWLK